MKPLFGRLFVLALTASSLIFIFTTSTVAQDLDDVTISGRVIDANNAPIVGASVTATQVETTLVRTIVTNEEGHFRIVDLPPGTYNVKAASSGFAAKENLGLITIAGQNLQLDFSLSPAGVVAEQTVTINDEDAPAVDTTRTVVGGTVVQREIEELPNISRSPLDLVFTLGGVTEEPLSSRDLAQDKGARGESAGSAYSTVQEAGVFSLSGGAAYSNNITIDGLDNNDDRAASFRFQPSLDAISEVQVITNQFSAEYGRASGGRVNFRTRSGTKNFRGRVSYFFRDARLNANTWRNNSRGIERPELQEHIPVISFGGPIPFGYFRNKTFFFAAYEYQNLKEDTIIDTFVPVAQNSRFSIPAPTDPNGQVCERPIPSLPAAQISPCALAVPTAAFVAPFVEAVPTPLRNHTLSARLDHNFTDNHNVTFNFQYGKRQDFRQFSGGSRLAEALIGNSRDTQGFSFTDNYVFSSNLVNQARFQYSTLKPQVISDTSLQSPVILITLNSALDRGSSLIAGSSTSGSSDRQEDRWQFQDSLSYVVGGHTFKFGGDIQRVKSVFIDRGDVTGTFNFGSVLDYLNNNLSRFRQNFGTTSTQQNTYVGLFFQDEWRLRPNFTLSYGLRYENETIIDDKNNFGPRFAIAWDPFKKGKDVVRFGAGIFYNRALLRTIDDFTLTTNSLIFDTNAIPFGGQRTTVLDTIEQRFPQALTIEDAQQICTSNNINCGTGAFGRILDPNLKLPESYQFNIGYEKEIGDGFVFEANYTWNKTINLWREFSANAPQIPSGFNSLAEYLLSQSFNNTAVNGVRPLYNVSGARNVIQFVTSFTPPPVGSPTRCAGTVAPTNLEQGGCMRINGVETTIINLGSTTAGNSSPPITVALAAVQNLRPDPTRTQLEQLVSDGNSQYNGLVLELRRRYRKLGYGFGSSFRIAYTLSSLKDDGVVNTSSAQIAGNFEAEWARGLQDRRHRLALSGTFDTPYWLGKLRFSPIIRLGSSAPFNLSGGGVDRNLDDVNNDRPNFSGDIDSIVYRNPGEPFPQEVFDALSRPTIGAIGGDLPRNAGRGPGFFLFDLNISREFKFNERIRLRPNIEINNILNARVFSFGAAFINATDPQTTFLVPTRTYRPREIRLGIRFDF